MKRSCAVRVWEPYDARSLPRGRVRSWVIHWNVRQGVRVARVHVLAYHVYPIH